jgi:hypothetical protein
MRHTVCEGNRAQRMQMVADDGPPLFEDCIASISHTMPNGWPKGEQLRDEALRICVRR